MISQKEFDDTIKEFNRLENRGSYYPMFLRMIEKNLKTEAFLFILSTWNFAVFRYAMKEFDLNNFEELVKSLDPLFERFNDQNIRDIKLDDYKGEINEIFDKLAEIKGIQFTGASKLMHLTRSNVFIMWDGYIRKACGLKKGDSNDYYEFLKKMQEEFKHIKNNSDRTLAKTIDEYNYIKYTIPALQKIRDKKKKS